MIPKPFYLQRPKLSFLFFFLFYSLISSLLLLLLLLFIIIIIIINIIIIVFFFKFTYSRTKDYNKESSDDGILNLERPPSERYTVTNLEPDTFYEFYFKGISSCGQRLSQIIKAKTIGSGKLGPISYLYI